MRNLLSIIAFCYLMVLFYFQSSSWGFALGADTTNIYSRGVGVLGLPLINILLYCLYMATALLGYQQSNVYNYLNIRFYFWGFNALFFIFTIYGLATGVPFKSVFSSNGIINVFNMYLFVLVLLKIISTSEKLDKLSDFIIFCTLSRGIFGLIRWTFFGGDPANVYANLQKIAVRITFFDINDSLIATVGVFLAAWALMYGKPSLRTSRKLFYLITIGVGLAVILLSYRRTAWGGLILAGFWFVWQQPWRRRIQVGFIAGLIGMLTLPLVIGERFSKNYGLLTDITTSKGNITTTAGRFSELNYAWRYISESPLTGVMPWGGMGPSGSHGFVHSGIIHLWLKGGFFALLFFCLILWGYFLFTKKVRREIPYQNRGMAEAAFAGLLFSMPNICFGTPIPEFRTSLLLGLLFTLPYLVYGLKKSQDKPIPSPFALKALSKSALQLKPQ